MRQTQPQQLIVDAADSPRRTWAHGNVYTHDIPMPPARKRYSFWINEAEAEGLKAVKEAEGTTESEQIRQAIRDWLKRKGIGAKVSSRHASPRRKA